MDDQELLARAADSQALVALLGGGRVGKTRLVDQLAAAAEQQGVRVLGGGCVPLGEEGLPFAPVTEALRAWPTWIRPSWRPSPAPRGTSWAACCPSWP